MILFAKLEHLKLSQLSHAGGAAGLQSHSLYGAAAPNQI